MKKLSANYIFTGNGAPIKNGVVIVDDNGVIQKVLNPVNGHIGEDGIEKYEGIICPGFINTHCHLELSYLKGKISEHNQLHGFVKDVMQVRDDYSEEERMLAIANAEKEMIANGISAVGDISNGDSTFQQKAKCNLAYHTFIEVFGLDPNQAKAVLIRANELQNKYHDKSRVSNTAHAPYSMSDKLVELVNHEKNNLLTIHNQETASENELFKNGSGALFEQLVKFSDAIKNWSSSGKTSLQTYLTRYSTNKRMLLVHNTFTSAEDIAYAKNYSEKIFWCFCPNANEYIEGTQPDYQLFLNEKCTIGTDSLASNWSLSILDELKTISKKDTRIPLSTLIQWATFNGAQFLGFEQLGSIEKGKAPGLNLIKNVDLENLCLTQGSRVIPL